MAPKLKDLYDKEYVTNLGHSISESYPEFDQEKFEQLVFPELEELEMKDRHYLIAESLNEVIPYDYPTTLNIFEKVLGPEVEENIGTFKQGYWLAPYGTFVELYGGEYFEESTAFSKELTKRYTSEFCMRPIIRNYPEKSLDLLKKWSRHEHKRVRRLASECVRVYLPWSQKLTIAMDYFEDYFEILDNLKDDTDKAIQRSVGNNLNDLYKASEDHFDTIVKRWEDPDMPKERAWVIKHGSRTKNKKINDRLPG